MTDFQVCLPFKVSSLKAINWLSSRLQNRVGSKFGGGGVAGQAEQAVDRRERLRKLALETIDLAKVSSPPYLSIDTLS